MIRTIERNNFIGRISDRLVRRLGRSTNPRSLTDQVYNRFWALVFSQSKKAGFNNLRVEND